MKISLLYVPFLCDEDAAECPDWMLKQIICAVPVEFPAFQVCEFNKPLLLNIVISEAFCYSPEIY